MRFIPRKFHAVLDYLYGALLITSPWIIDFHDVRSATNVTYLLGLAIILVSLNTDYEGGATKVISMSSHLLFDIFGGFVLAISPWLFGFYDQTHTFHVAAGLFSILAGFCTVNKSQHPKAEHVDDRF